LVDKVADHELAAVERERDAGKIGLVHHRGDQRRQQILDECGYHGAEGGADHDTHGHVDDVAAQEKLLEAVHGRTSVFEARSADVKLLKALGEAKVGLQVFGFERHRNRRHSNRLMREARCAPRVATAPITD